MDLGRGQTIRHRGQQSATNISALGALSLGTLVAPPCLSPQFSPPLFFYITPYIVGTVGTVGTAEVFCGLPVSPLWPHCPPHLDAPIAPDRG